MKISKEEYLWQLRQYLHSIPEEEKLSALEYYENYFEEAGIENEQQVIEELGSPERLAEGIIRDLKNDEAYKDTVHEPIVSKDQAGTNGEPGWEKFRQQMDREERDAFERAAAEEGRNARMSHGRERGVNIWMILFLLVTSPVWLGIVLGIFGCAIGLIFGAIGLVIGLVITVIALILGLVVGGVIGIVKAAFALITLPFAAGFGICLSVVMIAGGIILVRLFAGIIKVLLPGVFRLFGSIIGGIIRVIKGMLRIIFG